MTATVEPSESFDSKGILITILIVFFLSIGIHNYSISSAILEFNLNSLFALGIHVIVMLLMEALVLGAIGAVLIFAKKNRTKSLIAFVFFAAVAFVTNIYLLYIAHVPEFMITAVVIHVPLFGLITFCAFVFGRLLFAIEVNRRLILGISGCLCVCSFFPYFALKPAQVDGADITPVAPAQDGARNIYFISFDSMIPSSLSDQILGVNSPAYMDTLEKNGARIFRNGFAGFIPTQSAMNSMLQLDPEKFDPLGWKDRNKFFSGISKSTLHEVFHSRGYKIQTLYENYHFGSTKGPYVDGYFVLENLRQACEHAMTDWAYVGFCHEGVFQVTATVLKNFGIEVTGAKQNFVDFLLERLKVTAREDQPWFTMAHFYMPGHTDFHYRYGNEEQHREYVEYFTSRSELAAEYLQEVIDFINDHDPEAVLLVNGDHGTFTTRTLGGAIRPDRIPNDESLWRTLVLDRHGINIAVWPGDICENELSQIHNAGFAPILQVGRAVIECGTNQGDPLAHDPHYYIPIGIRNTQRRLEYKDYLYE